MKRDTHALFFDIDGTLVSMATHAIPQSTVDALEKAKAAGHKIFIATGRPLSIIDNVGAVEHLVDGYITTNGAHCIVDGKTVNMIPIPPEEVDIVLDDARQYGYSCVVVSEHHFFVFQPHEDVDRIFRQQLNITRFDLVEPLEVVMKEPVLQFNPFIPVEHEPVLMAKLKECLCQGRWHPEFTDITTRHADKGRALATIADHVGIPLERTVAFGDGGDHFGLPVVINAFGIRDRRLVEEGERLAKCVQIIIIARFADARVLFDRVVSFHPVEGGFHANVVFVDFCVDEAFEAGIGHGAIGAEHLGTVLRRTAAAWRSGGIRWPHGVRRTVDEAAFIVRRGGFDPCGLVGLLQVLAVGDERKRLVPREFCRRRSLRVVVERLLVQMFRDMESLHGPCRIGKI